MLFFFFFFLPLSTNPRRCLSAILAKIHGRRRFRHPESSLQHLLSKLDSPFRKLCSKANGLQSRPRSRNHPCSERNPKMGTCVSKSKKEKRGPPRHSTKESAAEQDAASRNPPEEEKVKEVLSETPKPSFPARPIEKVRAIEKERPTEEEVAEKPHPPSPEKIWVPQEEESVEVSETVSVSDTTSAAVTEDSNATEVQQPSRRGPFSGRREGLQATNSASPARREASPARRLDGVGRRAVSARRDATSPAGERRNVVRRVTGEVGRSNGPRSRSPATRGDLGGLPAAKRSGSRRIPRSPSRGPASAAKDRGQGLGDDVGGGGGVGGGGNGGLGEMKPQEQSGSAPNESLENPLVAMECLKAPQESLVLLNATQPAG